MGCVKEVILIAFTISIVGTQCETKQKVTATADHRYLPSDKVIPNNLVVAEGLGIIDLEQDQSVNNFVESEENQVNTRENDEPWYKEHYDQLTAGLTIIDGTYKFNSVLCLFGKDAFPIAVNGRGEPTIAGAISGNGRVIAMGRVEYLFDHGSMKPFLENAVRWLANKESNETITTASRIRYGLAGFQTSVNFPPLQLAENPPDIYAADAGWGYTDEELAAVLAFVRNGGGLIVSGQAWYWGSYAKNSYAKGFPGNKLLVEFGLMVDMFDHYKRAAPVQPMPSKYYNLYYAIAALGDGTDNSVAANTRNLMSWLCYNGDTKDMPQFQGMYDLYMDSYLLLDATRDLVAYSQVTQTALPMLLERRPESIAPASNHAKFPYAVPEGSPRVSKTMNVTAKYAGQPYDYWYSGTGRDLYLSTGLYAAAGEIIEIELSEPALVGALNVQIGIHLDSLYGKSSPPRSPQITTGFNINKQKIKATNPWGGLIYISIPRGSNKGTTQVTISNAVQAPYFVLGETTKEEWDNKIKDYPAPWAELEIPGQIVLSVKSSEMRKTENIIDLASMWKKVMDATDYLTGYNNGSDARPRPERFALDIQISAGWMHSGYPMMGFLSAHGVLLSYQWLNKHGFWGPIHEIGHNMQWGSWLTGPTTDTTNNIYAVYVNEKVFNKTRNHPNIAPEVSENRIRSWVQKGKPFKDWWLWLALDTFLILAENLGWEAFPQVFAAYRTGTISGLGTDMAKYDMLARQFSMKTNLNLCPYFEWWQFSLTADTLAVCDSLPSWDVNPMSKYDQ